MEIKIALSQIAARVFADSGKNPMDYGPAYGGESVGLDLYNMGPEIVIPGRTNWTHTGEETLLIPTGVRVALPKGTVGLIRERGSVVKTGLFARAGVIDPGYTGEIFVNLVNAGEKYIKIPTGMKLPVQLIVVPCYHNYKVIPWKEYTDLTSESARESGSVGSSD